MFGALQNQHLLHDNMGKSVINLLLQVFPLLGYIAAMCANIKLLYRAIIIII